MYEAGFELYTMLLISLLIFAMIIVLSVHGKKAIPLFFGINFIGLVCSNFPFPMLGMLIGFPAIVITSLITTLYVYTMFKQGKLS